MEVNFPNETVWDCFMRISFPSKRLIIYCAADRSKYYDHKRKRVFADANRQKRTGTYTVTATEKFTKYTVMLTKKKHTKEKVGLFFVHVVKNYHVWT